MRSFALALAVVAPLLGANWPQWRGPTLNGVSSETGLPVQWDQSTNVAWKLAMPGPSGSTPIVWGDRIFVSTGNADTVELWCIERTKGQALWKKLVSPSNFKVRKGNMSSPSPVTDGTTVWVLAGTGHLRAFDFSGKELWSRDLQQEYGKWGLNHGYGSSPLLHQGAIYVQVLHGMHTDDPSYVLKIDGKTGKTLWKQERPTDAQRESPDSYTTPVLLTRNKRLELVITGGDYVTGHDLNTGKELWRGGGMNPEGNPFNRIIASPLVNGDMVYVPTRIKPLQAFRPAAAKPELVWATPNGPDVPTPVTDGKLLYVINDKGIAYCFDARTGAEVYAGQRIRPGTYSSSPVLADGRIYITSEEGLTIVMRAGPKFEVLSENPMNDYTLSSLAVSDGQLFMRTTGHLYAIGQRKQ
ncbi:MAG TPA: PQQ-binding-like beta-propeller repeat protein [Bryobacteraceae bacterium]|nr:PQQ-binding-like beta-propeller repeat protein [Bryobacteraceae bacterium]